jgi:hypothetical protein
LRLRSAGDETFSLPGHDLRAGASVEAGFEAEGRNGLRLFATVAVGGRTAGTETTRRSATVGVRWAW